MKLLEYKGKELLKNCGIRIPPGIVVNNKSYAELSFYKNEYADFFFTHKKVIIKAQVTGGARKKNGLIEESENYDDSLRKIDELYKKKHNEMYINTLLIEKKLDIDKEYFISITYDTESRKPVIIFSAEGGVNVEETNNAIKSPISPNHGLKEFEARSIIKKEGVVGRDILQISEIMMKCFKCFQQYECRILEINPLIKTKDGLFYAGDAKITLDENAIPRLQEIAEFFDSDRTFLSERESEARKIDINNYRGVAGKTFIELDGDIAVLASGGGASLACMDALIEAGGKPSNYAEYSGNPSKEKIKKLTEITLSKKGITGCLVIGGTANFTDIYETLSGFCEGLLFLNEKPKYPIVIRRAGPRDKEAFEMVRKFAEDNDFNIYLFGEETAMTEAVKLMVKKAEEYKNVS